MLHVHVSFIVLLLACCGILFKIIHMHIYGVEETINGKKRRFLRRFGAGVFYDLV